MMTTYTYENKSTKPVFHGFDEDGNLVSGMRYDIEQANFTPSLVLLRWDETDARITVEFDGDLTTEEQGTLDSIVLNY